MINNIKYKKYWRKTSLKQEGIGESFLKLIIEKKPKNFLEIGVFHGVTSRNVCELLFNSCLTPVIKLPKTLFC